MNNDGYRQVTIDLWELVSGNGATNLEDFFYSLCRNTFSNDATANRLRDHDQGDLMSAFTLPRVAGEGKVAVNPGTGKPQVLLFFAISPDFRKKRSLALLATLNELKVSYKNRVEIVAVHSDPEPTETVVQYMKDSSLQITLLDDAQRDVYNRYGVFMMPLVVLLDAQGKLYEVIPYTYNIRELVEGNLKVMLGEWSVEQLQEYLTPKEEVIRSPEEKEYIRRINYGKVMGQRKMWGQAIREFSTAIKILPGLVEGRIELGFALLKVKDWDSAEHTFREALKLDSESDGAIAGLGLALYGKGDFEAALPELENAFIVPDPRLEVIIALADICEKTGKISKAMRLNKLAISRLMILYEHRWQ